MMIRKLKKIYLFFTVPVVGLFAVYGILKEFSPNLVTFSLPSIIQFVVFVIAALTSIAGPVFLRTLFASKVRDVTSVEEETFYRFQRNILIITLLTPYFALFSMLFSFMEFYSAFIILFSLYSLYYFYPSERRVGFDRRIFRVK